MKCQLATRSNVLLRTFSQDNHSIVCISDTVGLNMPLYNMFKISISVCINWLFLWLKDLWYWQMPTYMCNHWIKFCCNFIPVAFFVTVVCHWLYTLQKPSFLSATSQARNFIFVFFKCLINLFSIFNCIL